MSNLRVQWEIGGVNISNQLLDYRKACIEKARQTKSLDTPQQQLALNSIYLMDDFSNMEYDIEEETWHQMLDECKSMYHTKELPDEAVSMIRKVAKMAYHDYDEIWNTVAGFQDTTFDKDITTLQSAYYSLIPLYRPASAMRDGAHKSMFSLNAVYPLFVPFLVEEVYLKRLATDGEAIGSTDRCHASDLSMAFEYGSVHPQRLLIVEVKPPHVVKDRKRPDYAKLANEMKDALDTMVAAGIDDFGIPVVGILVEGFRCSVFIMDLIYQAVYRLIPLQTFYIPRAHDDFLVLDTAFEVLLTVKKMVLSSAKRCLSFTRFQRPETIRGAYVVKSFDTPMKTQPDH